MRRLSCLAAAASGSSHRAPFSRQFYVRVAMAPCRQGHLWLLSPADSGNGPVCPQVLWTTWTTADGHQMQQCRSLLFLVEHERWTCRTEKPAGAMSSLMVSGASSLIQDVEFGVTYQITKSLISAPFFTTEPAFRDVNWPAGSRGFGSTDNNRNATKDDKSERSNRGLNGKRPGGHVHSSWAVPLPATHCKQ